MQYKKFGIKFYLCLIVHIVFAIFFTFGIIELGYASEIIFAIIGLGSLPFLAITGYVIYNRFFDKFGGIRTIISSIIILLILGLCSELYYGGMRHTYPQEIDIFIGIGAYYIFSSIGILCAYFKHIYSVLKAGKEEIKKRLKRNLIDLLMLSFILPLGYSTINNTIKTRSKKSEKEIIVFLNKKYNSEFEIIEFETTWHGGLGKNNKIIVRNKNLPSENIEVVVENLKKISDKDRNYLINDSTNYEYDTYSNILVAEEIEKKLSTYDVEIPPKNKWSKDLPKFETIECTLDDCYIKVQIKLENYTFEKDRTIFLSDIFAFEPKEEIVILIVGNNQEKTQNVYENAKKILQNKNVFKGELFYAEMENYDAEKIDEFLEGKDVIKTMSETNTFFDYISSRKSYNGNLHISKDIKNKILIEETQKE